MRITFVLPFAALAGGVRVIATYARVLTEQGHEVYVVSAARSRRGRLRDLWLRLSGRKHRIKKKKTENPLLGVLGARHIHYNPDKPFDPNIVPDGDAVFATWWRTADIVNTLPPSKGHKFYLLQDYEVLPPHPHDEVVSTYSLPLHKIAVSSWISDTIRKKHAVEEIDVVPNAVDAVQFSAPERTKGTPFTVGFLFNSHPRKRCDLAIEAIKLARAQLPDLRVVVFAGRTPPRDPPLPDWVKFHLSPDQTKIPKLYQSCDLWLFPSAQEGFGLPLLEAMASRTPVLATPAGAAPDLIDGTNGLLLPAGSDADAFCAQILAFARMGNDEWQTYSKAAHKTAQRYDWPETARTLASTIERVIEREKRGKP